MSANLQAVTHELQTAGDEVVNRFLSIAPLLGFTQHGAGPTVAGEDNTSQDRAPVDDSLPAPSYAMAAVERGGLAEDVFFERFARLVEEAGFRYSELDLKSFHLSVKSGTLTVLGGPSGTGKSSLPMLYAAALNGAEAAMRPACQMVSVSPAWVEGRDLIGHLSSLDGQFYPAENGLFLRLVEAAQEWDRLRGNTGLHLICLDEMNLAQVEHYFSDFLTVLERPQADRRVPCFDQLAAANSRYRAWAQLTVSPAARFVGTVNFDETTRLLSDRLLDRANLIELATGELPAATPGTAEMPPADGPCVTYGDYESWLRQPAMPGRIATVLDDLRPRLAAIGCPVSPRVFGAMKAFIGAAEPLLDPATAFDLQLVQRVLTRLRTTLTQAQSTALDELLLRVQGYANVPLKATFRRLAELQARARSDFWLAGE